MGIFRWNRPYGVALLRLREVSLSLSDRHTRRYYLGVKSKPKRSPVLELLIWFLIFTGVVLAAWGLCLCGFLFFIVFIA